MRGWKLKTLKTLMFRAKISLVGRLPDGRIISEDKIMQGMTEAMGNELGDWLYYYLNPKEQDHQPGMFPRIFTEVLSADECARLKKKKELLAKQSVPPKPLFVS